MRSQAWREYYMTVNLSNSKLGLWRALHVLWQCFRAIRMPHTGERREGWCSGITAPDVNKGSETGGHSLPRPVVTATPERWH